jgi:hypothetical protein
LREELPRSNAIISFSAEHLARIIANILPGLGHSTIHSAPHRRRTEQIVDDGQAQDADRDRGDAISHRCEHTLRRIDIGDRYDRDRVARQDGGVGPKAAEVAPDEDANTYPENESREQADPLTGKEAGDHDRHRGADERRRNSVDGFRKRRAAGRLRQDRDSHRGR